MILAGVILCFFGINTGYTQVSLEINITSTFKAPGPSPQGLAWDGAYLWLSDDSTDTIYKINPQDGSVLLSFDSPGPEPKGLTSDTTHIWSLDDSLRYIYKLNKETGAVIDSLEFPAEVNYISTIEFHFRGLAWDGNYLWISYLAGWSSSAVRINPGNGDVDTSFFCYAEDIAFDGTYLWNVSQNGSYKGFIEKREIPSGRLISIFRSPGYYPTGLTFDGTYFWLADIGTDSLYQIQVLMSNVEDLDKNPQNAPYDYTLHQNYPNPTNLKTCIRFSIPEEGKVSLRIFNIKGQEVRTLVDDHREAGVYTEVWNGIDNHGLGVPSGIYLYALQIGNKVFTKKLTLVK